MKIASWNVNSLRVRLPQVLDWLDNTGVDILGVQETKMQDPDFPVQEIEDAGYSVVYSGQKTYNGVALLVRNDSVIKKFGSFDKIVTDLPGIDDPQRRVIIANLGAWRIANLYVPNGSAVDSDKYEYKLEWLQCLYKYLKDTDANDQRTVILGDFNIAPDDRDVHNPAGWEGKVLVSPRERASLQSILDLGFSDSFRQFEQEANSFSWWDYRGAGFRRNHGLRIDLILTSAAATSDLVSSSIDRGPRGLERPSDHTPVVAEFTLS